MDFENAITARRVTKVYPGKVKTEALADFSLDVQQGAVCALLGPNGAGKTTAIKILTTLLEFDAGEAKVAGFDVQRQPRRVRERIGLVGQFAAIDEILTGKQNLMMFAELLHLGAARARQRADELLEQFSLTDAASRPVGTYSGGMRRRLDLASGLVTSPPVLFVDEPTTGLDPLGRRQVWDALRALVANGTTILLTTQYLEEADNIADRISILQAGRIIADGTPDALKSAFGGDRLDLVLRPGTATAPVVSLLESVAVGEIEFDENTNRVSAPVRERTRALVAVANGLAALDIEPDDISLRRPTLDEVFIHLTGASDIKRSKPDESSTPNEPGSISKRCPAAASWQSPC